MHINVGWKAKTVCKGEMAWPEPIWRMPIEANSALGMFRRPWRWKLQISRTITIIKFHRASEKLLSRCAIWRQSMDPLAAEAKFKAMKASLPSFSLSSMRERDRVVKKIAKHIGGQHLVSYFMRLHRDSEIPQLRSVIGRRQSLGVSQAQNKLPIIQ